MRARCRGRPLVSPPPPQKNPPTHLAPEDCCIRVPGLGHDRAIQQLHQVPVLQLEAQPHFIQDLLRGVLVQDEHLERRRLAAVRACGVAGRGGGGGGSVSSALTCRLSAAHCGAAAVGWQARVLTMRATQGAAPPPPPGVSTWLPTFIHPPRAASADDAACSAYRWAHALT
jgi:hypothetical protein